MSGRHARRQRSLSGTSVTLRWSQNLPRTIARMQTASSNFSTTPGTGYAAVGLVLTCIGGLCVAQANPGSDREFFLSAGFMLSAAGSLLMMIGAVAIGIRVARD